MLQLGYLYFICFCFDSIVLVIYFDWQYWIFEWINIDLCLVFGRMMIDVKYDYYFCCFNIILVEFEKIDFECVKIIYLECFVNIGDFQLIFVGNFRLDSLMLLVEQYFGFLFVLDQEECWVD